MSQQSLKFSITDGPPSADQLAAEQRRIDVELAAVKAKKKRAMVVFVLVALAGLAAIYNIKLAVTVGAAFWGVHEVGALLVGTVVTAVVFVSNVWMHRNILEPLAALEVDQDLLDLLPQDYCPPVLAMCQQHAAIAAYQARVASEPRLLVRGDAQAMDDWVAGKSLYLKEAAQQAACKAACQALREPIGAPTLA